MQASVTALLRHGSLSATCSSLARHRLHPAYRSASRSYTPLHGVSLATCAPRLKGCSRQRAMATTAARAGAAAAGDRFAAVHTHTPHAAKIPGQHRSCWGQDLLRPGRYPRLAEDVEADVVVVGGGLAGLATAYRLAKAGKSVVVLEARTVGGGNSGKGLGLVSTWTTDHYHEVEKMAGSETARHVSAAHASAVDWVTRVVREEGIECELELGEAVVAAVAAERGGVAGAAASTAGAGEGYGKWKKDKASRELREELAAALRSGLLGGRIEHLPPATAAARAGGEGASSTPTHTASAAPGVGVGVAPEPLPEEVMLVPGCAALHPVRFLLGLADAVVRRGGRIFEDSRAKGGLVTGPSGGVVKTMHGPVAKAREAVVLATHSPINRNQLWVHDRQLPKRDYTIGLEIPAGSAPRQLHRFLNLAKGSGAQPHSARVTALPAEVLPGPHEGGGGSATSYEANKELLLLRGSLHHHGHDEKQYGDPWGDLERWARRHVPQAGRVLFCWSAADYYPADLMGLYGRDPLDLSSPPVYILTGHGGQEWTSATLGSEVVAGTILQATGAGAGANPAWGAAYRPARVVPGAAWKYTSELTQYFSTVGVSLLKHVVPRSLEDVAGMVAPRSVEANIKPGEGRVAQHGLLKKALYRDPEGVLHVKSALCTHLGCCVEWNPLEKTFDCPCHGSQYDSCGRCIHAPAVGDLEDLGTRQ